MGIVSKIKSISKKKLPVIGIVSIGAATLIVAALAYMRVNPFVKLRGAVIYLPNKILVLLKMNPIA